MEDRMAEIRAVCMDLKLSRYKRLKEIVRLAGGDPEEYARIEDEAYREGKDESELKRADIKRFILGGYLEAYGADYPLKEKKDHIVFANKVKGAAELYTAEQIKTIGAKVAEVVARKKAGENLGFDDKRILELCLSVDGWRFKADKIVPLCCAPKAERPKFGGGQL